MVSDKIIKYIQLFGVIAILVILSILLFSGGNQPNKKLEDKIDRLEDSILVKMTVISSLKHDIEENNKSISNLMLSNDSLKVSILQKDYRINLIQIKYEKVRDSISRMSSDDAIKFLTNKLGGIK